MTHGRLHTWWIVLSLGCLGGTGVGCIGDGKKTGSGSGAQQNRPPNAEDATVVVAAGTQITQQLQASDPDGGALVFALITSSQAGAVVALDATNGQFSYTAAVDFAGTETLTYRVEDVFGAQATASIHVTVVPQGTITGTLSYAYVPTTCTANPTNCFLDYEKTVERPIRGVRVQAVGPDLQEILGEATSDDLGKFTLTYTGDPLMHLAVWAETLDPPVTIRDNTSDDAIYVVVTDAFDAEEHPAIELLADSGWDGSHYTQSRSSAPFAILDTIYTAARKVLDAADVTLPPLPVRWSVHNRPEQGRKSQGQITTSHWDGVALYILGYADVDTDEFDSHVIVHEWGHYFEASASRMDSWGGIHQQGWVVDPRLAFSEGWGNALSGMILFPNTRYSDTLALRQAVGYSFDIESNYNDATGTATADNCALAGDRPGWFSEFSSQAILYDLFDAASDCLAPGSGGGSAAKGRDADPDTDCSQWDEAALGLAPLIAVMTGSHRQTAAFTTIFSFIQGLKEHVAADASAVAAIDALLAAHGISPVQDEFGTGEIHNGGSASFLPVYHDGAMCAGGNATDPPTAALRVMLDRSCSGNAGNTLASNRYIKIAGMGRPVGISVRCDESTDVVLVKQGQIERYNETYCNNVTCQTSMENVPLADATTYLLNLVSTMLVDPNVAQPNEPYACDVEITCPTCECSQGG